MTFFQSEVAFSFSTLLGVEYSTEHTQPATVAAQQLQPLLLALLHDSITASSFAARLGHGMCAACWWTRGRGASFRGERHTHVLSAYCIVPCSGSSAWRARAKGFHASTSGNLHVRWGMLCRRMRFFPCLQRRRPSPRSALKSSDRLVGLN